MSFESLFSKYDRLVLFDTETTGLLFARDEIIEFAGVVVERVNGVPKVVQEYDELIALSPGGFVPPKIEQLTGITTQDLADEIPGSVWFDTFQKVADYLKQNIQKGDLVITLGCGDVYKIAHLILRGEE